LTKRHERKNYFNVGMFLQKFNNQQNKSGNSPQSFTFVVTKLGDQDQITGLDGTFKYWFV
jgi:hypothetical protein